MGWRVKLQARRGAGLATAAILGICGAARAEVLVVKVGDPPARMDLLKPGSHSYLRYTVTKDGKRIAQDIWNRKVSYEDKDGKRLLHITQRWDEAKVAAGGASALEQDSWFDARTFRPLTHVRRATVGDGVKIAGYRFLDDKAVGMTELADNAKRDFSISYSETPFNFEYDMELIQTLPLHAGLEANIIFYDAGIDKKADRYTFKVAGSDTLTAWDGRPVECWVITADYNTGVVKSRWWVDKASQLLLREDAKADDGGTFIKTLLPPEAVDAPTA